MEISRRGFFKLAGIGAGAAAASVAPEFLRTQDSQELGSFMSVSDEAQETIVLSVTSCHYKDIHHLITHPSTGASGFNMDNLDGSIRSSHYASYTDANKSSILIETVSAPRYYQDGSRPGVRLVTTIARQDLITAGSDLSDEELSFAYPLFGFCADGTYIKDSEGTLGLVARPFLSLGTLLGNEEFANSIRNEIYNQAKNYMTEEEASKFSTKASIPFTAYKGGRVVLFNPNVFQINLVPGDQVTVTPNI